MTDLHPHASVPPGPVGHLPARVPVWRVMQATIRKDLAIAKRYLPDLLARFADLAVRVVFFLLFANVASINAASSPLGHAITGRELMIYFQGALTLFVFNAIALSAPVNAVNRDLYNGTLEYLYTSPSSRYGYFVGTILASALISQVIFLPVFSVLILYSKTGAIDALLVLGACLAVLATVVALGIMIAISALLWRQVASVASVVSILFELLAGAYFPINALPIQLQYVSLLLPYTWGYDLIRFYSFGRQWRTIFPVEVEWAALICFALLFLGLSGVLLTAAERRAKRQGLHLI